MTLFIRQFSRYFLMLLSRYFLILVVLEEEKPLTIWSMYCDSEYVLPFTSQTCYICLYLGHLTYPHLEYYYNTKKKQTIKTITNNHISCCVSLQSYSRRGSIKIVCLALNK